MALKISIKPGEKIIINGAVISIGDRGNSIILQNHATFLRGKDIMQEEEADTPAKRIYFHVMLMYLDQDNTDSYYNRFMDFMNDLMQTTGLHEVRRTLMHIFTLVNAGKFYQALKACKALVEFEREILNYKTELGTGSET